MFFEFTEKYLHNHFYNVFYTEDQLSAQNPDRSSGGLAGAGGRRAADILCGVGDRAGGGLAAEERIILYKIAPTQ